MNTRKKELSSTNLYFYLILFVLIFPAFVDLINGFIQLYLAQNFSVGIMYRSMLLLITIPFVFYLKERLYQLYLFLLIVLWVIFNFVWFVNGFYHTFYSFLFELYFLLSIALFIGHSFFAGHASTNSYVATVIAIVYLYVLKLVPSSFLPGQFIVASK